MKNLKKLSRQSLKTINGSKLAPSYGGGFGCSDACTPSNGFCEQFGLTCGVWSTTGPDGSVTSACFKCL
ncbi:bacteriocin-like protein [Chryseobacterium ginsenosidimutans]|uniref:bacteriocin-like protein n=1 Tax=Chryseobacterium ginsenosidimutans TaxID=687846 RepID=UPI003CD073B1